MAVSHAEANRFAFSLSASTGLMEQKTTIPRVLLFPAWLASLRVRWQHRFRGRLFAVFHRASSSNAVALSVELFSCEQANSPPPTRRPQMA